MVDRMRPMGGAVLLTLSLALAACQTLMPTPEQPYRLADATAVASTPWQWRDARGPVSDENRWNENGLVFGDRVMQPRPYEHLQAEFARAVNAHPQAAALRRHLTGHTLELHLLEVSVGLWARLSQRQTGDWEFVRVRLGVALAGQRFDGTDVHRFNNNERPSPVNLPLRNAVDNLVQQLWLFGASDATTSRTDNE